MNDGRKEIWPKLAVAALIFTYITLSTASSLATKPRHGPDEPAHFIYVREIGEHFRLPGLAHKETHDIHLHSSHEGHQPPLYYALAAIPYAALNLLGAKTDTIWLIVRLFTVLFGAGWVYFLYRLSKEILNGRHYQAVLAAACVGLLPLSTYIGGVVNNDAAMAMLFTASMWLVVRSIRRADISLRAAVQIGLVSGLAILTKSQGLFLLPVIAVAALMIAKRREWKASRRLMINAVLAILLAGAVSSVWFIRNWWIYGSPIIQSLHNPLIQPGDIPSAAGWIAIGQLITDYLFRYFWTPYWLIGFDYNHQSALLYIVLLLVLCFLIIVGLIIHLDRCRSAKSRALDCRLGVWMLMAFPGILVYIFLFRHTVYVDQGALSQGRLLLPVAYALGAAAVVGLRAIIHDPVIRIIDIILRTLARRRDFDLISVHKMVDIVLGGALAVGIVAANLIMLRAIMIFYSIR